MDISYGKTAFSILLRKSAFLEMIGHISDASSESVTLIEYAVKV